MLHNLCYICLISTSICDALHGFAAMRENTDLLVFSSSFSTIPHILADVFYFISSFSLYIILIHRLYLSFYDSAYAITKWIFYWISFQLCVQIIFMVGYVYILIIQICPNKVGCERLAVIAWIIAGNDYILNIICITLLIRTLRKVIVDKLRTEIKITIVNKYTKNNNNNNCHDQEALSVPTSDVKRLLLNGDETNSNFLKVITKQTVIGIGLILMNQTFATSAAILFTFIHRAEIYKWVMIAYIARGIESAIICLLLYLGLSINDTEYGKCCKYCHIWCYSLNVKSTAKTVKRAVRQMSEKNNNDMNSNGSSYIAMQDISVEND